MKRESASITPPTPSWGTTWAKPAVLALIAVAMVAALVSPGSAPGANVESADAGEPGTVTFLSEFDVCDTDACAATVDEYTDGRDQTPDSEVDQLADGREPSSDGPVDQVADGREPSSDGDVDQLADGRDPSLDAQVEAEAGNTVLAPVQDSEVLISDRLTATAIKPVEAQPESFFTGTGKGIDVALIDTGVSRVVGLDEPGRVLYGPDLSNEAEFDNLANLDTYGHGTHMAGIIVGRDNDGFQGIAPDARLISLKVAGATGETHVAQVIAAIDWVVEHRNADGMNIRVLNLSLGQPGATTHVGDHLAAAVERAWDAGIVVVVAGGNQGNDSNGLDSPAVSPLVIATAGLDGESAKDGIASWSSSGDGVRNPDLAATGRSIISLRVPGSTLDTLYPEARVGQRFFRASGTSQAAATMSGTVARLLSTEPNLTPDQVKLLLMKTAQDVEWGLTLDGYGKPQLEYAAVLASRMSRYPMTQRHARAIPGSAAIDTWSGGSWNGAVWSGGTWNGAQWNATWSGAVWSATWSGAVWNTATWSATWSGAVWNGKFWHGLDEAVDIVDEIIDG